MKRKVYDAYVNTGKLRPDGLYTGTSFYSSWKEIEEKYPSEENRVEYCVNHTAAAKIRAYLPTYVGQGIIDYECSFDRLKYNACHHVVSEGVSLPYGYFIKGVSNPSAGYYCGCWRTSPSGSPQRVDSHLTLQTAFAANRAWWTMQPRFEGKISLINFLIELKDLKSLAKHGYKIMHKLGNLRKTLNHYRRNPTYDPTKACAKVYLEYQFGIAPLLKDLSIIWKQMSDIVREVQDEFAAKGQSDDGITSHYTETLASTTSVKFGSGNNRYIQTGTVKETIFTATMQFNYDYKLREGFEAFTKYWGLSGSAEAFWEAIPFSFLADYFVKIGKAIHAMEVDPNVKIYEHKYCESIKTTFTSGVHVGKTDPGIVTLVVDGKSTNHALVAGYSGKKYNRAPCSPRKGLYIPRINNRGLSNDQKTIIGALIRSAI